MVKRERASGGGEPRQAAAKRASTGEGEEVGGAEPAGKLTYRAGSITKVKVKNFMTYAACEIKPAPKLNLVLGPNGTGKSSFVCAICVGLGGSTKLLGRADSVKEFIRRGQQEGSTEIHISDGVGGKHRVFRKIMANNKSEWKIDGRPSNHSEVKKLVEKYNIQLDNLCSFLPQDKVVEFARLKPRELLTETEKALGDAHLHNLHEQLIEIRNSMKNNQNTLDAYNKELEKLRQSNSSNERDVESWKQREALLEQRDLRNLKRPWLEALVAKEEYRTKKDAKKAKAEELKALRAELEKEQEPLRLAKQQLQEAKQNFATTKTELRNRANDHNKLQSSIENIQDNDITPLKVKITNLETDSQKHRAKIDHQRSRLEKAKEDLAALPHVQDNERIEQLANEARQLDYQRRELVSELKEATEALQTPKYNENQLKEKIRQQDDQKMRKVQQLENKYKGITRMWLWVQSNGTAFRGKVWGPVLTEVKVSDQKLAAFLEMQVGIRVWSCFVTEYSEDQTLLMNECKRQLGKHNITIVNYNGNPREPLTYPRGKAEDYLADGIQCTLDAALVDTPDIITRVINDDSQICSAFVGCPSLQNSYESVLTKNKKIGTLYLPDTHVRVSTSRYNAAARSTEVSGIRRANLLANSTSNSQREQLQAQLEKVQNEIRSIEHEFETKKQQLKQVEDELQEKEDEKNALSNERQRAVTARRKLQSTINAQAKTLQSLEMAPDPLEEKPALERQLAKAIKMLGGFTDPLMGNYRNMCSVLKRLAIAEMKNFEADLVVKSIDRGSSEKRAQASSLEAAVAALQLDAEGARKRFEKAKKEAGDKAPYPEDKEGKEERQAQFATLPDDLEQLLLEIDSYTAEADAIVCANPQVMEEYKKRKAKIETLEEKAAKERDLVENGTGRIESIKGEWLPQLKDLVNNINDTFRVNFAEIGFAGEVELKEDDDFDKYEIQIKVKFRADEELQVLTASRQSGGERSVCTILYLIALQGVTECPFRVVDEINQGMDPNNERKVFKQLVESSCRPDTPQCFLLTPKLLPDLPFTPDVRVLNIFNGPWVGDVGRHFDVNDLLPEA